MEVQVRKEIGNIVVQWNFCSSVYTLKPLVPLLDASWLPFKVNSSQCKNLTAQCHQLQPDHHVILGPKRVAFLVLMCWWLGRRPGQQQDAPEYHAKHWVGVPILD